MLISVLALLLTGCSDPANDAGQSGEEGVSCSAVTSTEYALGDDTPLGFPGQAVADLSVGDHAGVVTWDAGGTTGLTVSVATDATTVTWNDNEWGDDGSGSEIASMEWTDCPDDLVLPVDLSFTTADGAFAETWSVDLHASVVDTVTAWLTLDVDALNGSYTVTEVDPTAFDGINAWIDLALSAAGPAGSIDGQATTSGDASDPDSTASATSFGIGTISAD